MAYDSFATGPSMGLEGLKIKDGIALGSSATGPSMGLVGLTI
jgi:hypothetical protein